METFQVLEGRNKMLELFNGGLLEFWALLSIISSLLSVVPHVAKHNTLCDNTLYEADQAQGVDTLFMHTNIFVHSCSI